MSDDRHNGIVLDQHARLTALAELMRMGFPDDVTVTKFIEWKTDAGPWHIEITAILHEEQDFEVSFEYELRGSSRPWVLLRMSKRPL